VYYVAPGRPLLLVHSHAPRPLPGSPHVLPKGSEPEVPPASRGKCDLSLFPREHLEAVQSGEGGGFSPGYMHDQPQKLTPSASNQTSTSTATPSTSTSASTGARGSAGGASSAAQGQGQG